MGKFIFHRVLQTIPVIILVAFFSFAIIELAPGDVLMHYIQPNMTNEEIALLREELGLNDGLFEKFFGWAKSVLSGNLGYSQINHRSVAVQIAERIPATVGLMGASLLLSIVVSVPLGLLCGTHKNRLIDQIVSTLSYVGISVPSFWLGMVLIIVFSQMLDLLPSMGCARWGWIRYGTSSSTASCRPSS